MGAAWPVSGLTACADGAWVARYSLPSIKQQYFTDAPIFFTYINQNHVYIESNTNSREITTVVLIL